MKFLVADLFKSLKKYLIMRSSMSRSSEQRRELQQRVIAFLNREQVDFIDKIGKDALFSKGTKLSRSRIISSLVDLMIELDINGEGISSLEELKQRIKEKLHPVDNTGAAGLTPREIFTYKNNKGH
jgi:hypothetical protein